MSHCPSKQHADKLSTVLRRGCVCVGWVSLSLQQQLSFPKFRIARVEHSRPRQRAPHDLIQWDIARKPSFMLPTSGMELALVITRAFSRIHSRIRGCALRLFLLIGLPAFETSQFHPMGSASSKGCWLPTNVRGSVGWWETGEIHTPRGRPHEPPSRAYKLGGKREATAPRASSSSPSSSADAIVPRASGFRIFCFSPYFSRSNPGSSSRCRRQMINTLSPAPTLPREFGDQPRMKTLKDPRARAREMMSLHNPTIQTITQGSQQRRVLLLKEMDRGFAEAHHQPTNQPTNLGTTSRSRLPQPTKMMRGITDAL